MDQGPITYSLDHSSASVELVLAGDRLTARTKGKGLADKTRLIEIAVTDLELFCLVPTIGAQNLAAPRTAPDGSYDSEFIFSYREEGNLRKKRMFVSSRDESFRRFLDELTALRPDASLVHLEPAEALKRIGVISAAKTVYFIIAILVGIPLLIALFFIISAVTG